MDQVKVFLDMFNLSIEDWELIICILFQVLFLASLAVFSGSETALFSLSRIDLQKLRHSRHENADAVSENAFH